MKFAVLALIGSASAALSEEELFALEDPSPVGTACKVYTDLCGDADTMCCGTASGGHEVSGQPPVEGAAVPDITICNKKTDAQDFTGEAPDD